ncbi:uncharacterized protein B0H18DRAFT_959993 [Fomitopsis serialis]|uniref:uncharacterized protein n=1 Tax=Fomitopsis serialis TaxID=139415 RepID=UPI00200871AA|nr:uncharacterized protein B0H18DRAFT_959993 [Neoantrodia serialis]KAH9914213.1 hypothetical protein B0H18DRAFT_959993 [Neoantrodia serialis]
MIGSSNHVVSSSIATKMKEANMAMAKFHGDYRCDYCKRAEEWAQKRAAKVGKGPSEITPFICTISGRRKRCDFCSKGRRTPCSLQPYLINNLVSVDKDLVGTYTINHAPEATVTGIESNNKIYSAVRVQDGLPRTKRMTSPAKPKRKNAVKAAKRVARVRSSASQPRKRAQPRTPIATSVTGSSSHSNDSQSHVETDLLSQEGSRLRSTAEEALDGLCSDVRRLESEMYELRNTLEAERAFRKEVAVDLAKLRSEMDDLRAGAGVRSLAALELDISAFVAKVRRQLGSVDDRDDLGTTHQAALHAAGKDVAALMPTYVILSRLATSDDLQPVVLHAAALNAHGVHHPAAAAPSHPRRRRHCPSEAYLERRDPPAGGLKRGGLAREAVRQVDMGADIGCRRDESLRNVGGTGRFYAGNCKRLSPISMADSPPPEIDPQVQGDDHPRFTPSIVDGIVKATEDKGGELQVTQSVERYRRRAMPGREEEQTPYHVLAAPNARVIATLRAKAQRIPHLAADVPAPVVQVGSELRSVKDGPVKRIGIVGRTGAGKRLLMHALFSRLALVPQDNVLFKGTLRQNLDSEGTRTDAQLISAIQPTWLLPQNGAHDAVAEAKFSLDSLVGDEESNYSAGEKRMLVLYRALAKNSRIIVLVWDV